MPPISTVHPASTHLYQRIAATLEEQIAHEVLRVGDRLPSVRVLSREQGISVSTALQVFYQLESKGLIESRPQSGYYVRMGPRHLPALPTLSRPQPEAAPAVEVSQIISAVYDRLADPTTLRFSLGAPMAELLPVAKLTKSVVEAMRQLPGNGTLYEDTAGDPPLRRQLARWAGLWGAHLTADDLITTTGCMGALTLSLLATTRPGDTVAIESPIYFGILQLAAGLGLRVLELPTCAQTGLDLDALQEVLDGQKIAACLVVSNFQNPIGSCMPDENKKTLVRMLESRGIPLIEDDLYGDIYFGRGRPVPCKAYEQNGGVLWCGSVSKTLAPGFRVGWVAAGRYHEQVRRLKRYHSVATPALTERAVAIFLENGRYEHHLRGLRRTLQANALHYLRAVREWFPAGTRVSRPEGGFVLWVELPVGTDTWQLYQRAIQHGISIAPGRMFTLQDQYHDCLRLSYAIPWCAKVEQALRLLGELAGECRGT